MKVIRAVIIVVVLSVNLFGVFAKAQGVDPCSGLLQEGEVGLDYKGHCIIPDPAKGPVQGIFVRRVEDLDDVTIEGIVLMFTDKGWILVPEEFIAPVDGGSFATTAVEDGWHMVVDEETP
jgi:hypothetical protein